jgi:hypothetical protein
LESECERNLGELELRAGNLREAHTRFTRSLKVCRDAEDKRGERLDEKGPLPDLLRCCDGRRVYLLLDANIGSNPKVQAAENALYKVLKQHGCTVLRCRLPIMDGVNGPDDYIGKCGDEVMDKVLSNAQSGDAPKADVLTAGVLQQVRTVADLIATVDAPERLRQRPLPERLAILAEAGFSRLDAKRDLNRILHRRDLVAFPDLLAALRDEDLQRVFRSVTHWFEAEAGEETPSRDWQAIAAVLVGAIAHYWLLRDALGGHPDGVDERRYRAAWVEMALLLLARQEPSNGGIDQAMTHDVSESD